MSKKRIGIIDLEKIKKDKASLIQKLRDANQQLKQQDKKDLLRKKILVGGLVLDEINENKDAHKNILKALGKILTNNRDRALFGFEVLKREDQEELLSQQKQKAIAEIEIGEDS